MKEYSPVVEKFLRYVKVDTESVPEIETIPSSEKQKDLSRMLVEELKEMGASNAFMDDHGYVYAEIPSNIENDKKVPVLGFVAHVDTSPAVTGKDVKPSIVENYDGSDIVLNKDLGYILSPNEFPELKNYIGQDLIVTDGNTLLGADDKAGVAEIMAMAEFLLKNPDIKHGSIKIGFTPDEEVGKGADLFDVKGFGADFAYTIDGGQIGELEYENFNAASGKVKIYGKSIHPGAAKGQMINAILLAMEFQGMLPAFDNPAYTELYEGFFHLDGINGSVDNVTMDYIIRDHDRELFEEKKETFKKIGDYLNDKYGKGTFDVIVKDSYFNMKEKIEPHMHLISNAKKAMESLGITPIITPIRGGTDGARLSYMGLPCPNICTGGHNFHGRYEYIPVQSMEKIVELIIEIIKIYGSADERL